MNKRSLIIGLTAPIVMATTLWAVGPRLTPQRMHELATHVVTGELLAIYERTEKKGDWEYRHYIAEIRVGNAEKGESIRKGDLIYARYWRRKWIGKGPVPSSGMGQRGRQAEGDSIRAYLKRKDQDESPLFRVAAEDGLQQLE